MILIVESGSSKADWLLVEKGETKLSFQTKGWNPLFMDLAEMNMRLQSYKDLEPFFPVISQIFFYAPGVTNLTSKETLSKALDAIFVNASVIIESDLLAAARACYEKTPLFVSILGTGSNTAFYDGEVLQQYTPSLGYVLGDEGSGASLGKLLLKAYLYHSLPNDLHLEFSKKHSISKDLVLKSVYKSDKPNRFLASYAPFLVEHKKHPFVEELVRGEFGVYLCAHILSNKASHDFPLVFVGSVAYFFQDILKDLCVQNSLLVANIIQSPIKGLKAYHTS